MNIWFLLQVSEFVYKLCCATGCTVRSLRLLTLRLGKVTMHSSTLNASYNLYYVGQDNTKKKLCGAGDWSLNIVSFVCPFLLQSLLSLVLFIAAFSTHPSAAFGATLRQNATSNNDLIKEGLGAIRAHCVITNTHLYGLWAMWIYEKERDISIGFLIWRRRWYAYVAS